MQTDHQGGVDRSITEHLASVGALIPAAVHDLRNPINVIKTSVFFLQSKLLDADPRLMRHLELINRSCTSAALVLDDLLQYARPRGAALTFQPLAPIVQRAVDSVDLARVEFTPGSDLPDAPIDGDLVALAVRKMLQAAALRSPESDPIRLRIRSTDGAVQVIVEDAGATVSEQQRDGMFQALVGEDGARSTNVPAALITEIARLHHGRAWCEAIPGGGNRVGLELPLSPPENETGPQAATPG